MTSNTTKKLFRHKVLGLTGLMAVWPMAAMAQDAPPAEPGQSGAPGIADIIVTAQKRAENLQNVPIAIVALSQAQLEAGGVRNVQDLAATVPGILVSRDNIWGKVYIRGIGTNSVSVGTDTSVAEYIDGVYIARPSAAIQEFADVDRVEVLKGPQGTLYGRNATGGTIAVWTKRPSDHLEGDVNAIYGNYNSVRLRGSISGPVSDGVRVRLSGLFSDQDGYQSNIFAPGRRQYGDRIKGGRAAIDFGTSDVLTATIAADYTKTDSKLVGDKVFGAGYGVGKVGAPADPYVVNMNACQCATLEQYGVSGTLIWRPGAITLKSITAFRQTNLDQAAEIDRTQLDLFELDSVERSKTFSQEFQIASADNRRFTWLAGLYYFYENGEQDYEVDFKNPLGDSPFPTFSNPVFANNQTNSYSIFGQASYRLTDRLQITAGARYTIESKQFHELNISNFVAPPLGSIPVEQGPTTVTFHAFTPKIGIEFHPSDDVMLYASATRGFKSGGWNAVGSPQEPFKPEYIWDYAVGMKSTFFDRRLRLNVEAFYYDYTNLQVNQIQNNLGIAKIVNAASARIKGVDADIVAVPVNGLELGANIAYLDARYDSFQPDLSNAGLVYSGNRLPLAPDFSATVSAQYTQKLGDSSLVGRVELAHKSRTFFDSSNDPLISQGAYDLLSARLAYHGPNDRWEVAVFGNNLTKTVYYINGSNGVPLVGDTLTPGVPQTYGVQFSWSFR